LKLSHKITLLQLLLTIILFGFLVFTYLTYFYHYQDELKEYVRTITKIKKEEIYRTIRERTQKIQKNKKLYLDIHQRALELFRQNPKQNLYQLKAKLQKEFTSQDVPFELYLIDQNYTIFQTTYPKDLGLNLSLITDAKHYLDQTTEDKRIHIAHTVSIDALDMGYRVYSYAYVKKGLYLEMGFQDNNLKGSLIELLEHSEVPMQLFAIEQNNGFWRYYEIKKKPIDSKGKFFEHLKKFPTGLKQYGDDIIDAHLLQKTFTKFSNNHAYITTPLYDTNMFDKIGYIDFVMNLELDISKQMAILTKTKNIFYIFIFILALAMLLIFLFIRKNFTQKINLIVQNIKAKKPIDNQTLLFGKDELAFVAKEYNTLFHSLQKEIQINKKLLEENKRFIADTVHQIRTPLANIMMNSEMIDKAIPNTNPFTEQINASINMLTNSYEDLAYILSHDTIEYKAAKICLSDLLQERIKFFTTIAKVNLKSFAVDIEPKIYTTINPIECERLIDNNLSNAVKYALPNYPITISLHQDRNIAILEFRSYGKEIVDKKKLFEKNYRENSSKRGLGLGLHMVQKICRKYNIDYQVTYCNGQNIFTYIFRI